MGLKVVYSQFVKIKTAVIVLFGWGNLNIRLVRGQVLGSKPVADWHPLAKFIFTKSYYKFAK
jgi:hypothetical protein